MDPHRTAPHRIEAMERACDDSAVRRPPSRRGQEPLDPPRPIKARERASRVRATSYVDVNVDVGVNVNVGAGVRMSHACSTGSWSLSVSQSVQSISACGARSQSVGSRPHCSVPGQVRSGMKRRGRAIHSNSVQFSSAHFNSRDWKSDLI